MRFSTSTITVLAIASVLASCTSYDPLTKELRDEFANDLANLQFYTSGSMELRRELRSEDRGVAGGLIRIEEGRRIEVISLAKYTPGLFVQTADDDPDTLLMMFEPGAGADRLLPFKLDTIEDNRARRGGAPESLYFLRPDDDGSSITYGDRSYEVDKLPYLLVDLKQSVEVQKEGRRLPGVRLPTSEPGPDR